MWFAKHDFYVDAVDCDAQVKSNMVGINNINVTIVDVEASNWPQSNQRYDGLVVSRYLYRPLLQTLATMLNPGGVLIYETYMVGNERYGKPSNPDFLLRPNELFEAYSPLLNIVSFEQGEEEMPRPAVMQRICAAKDF